MSDTKLQSAREAFEEDRRQYGWRTFSMTDGRYDNSQLNAMWSGFEAAWNRRPSTEQADAREVRMQPIETAPRDREILVYNEFYGWYRTRRIDSPRGVLWPLYGCLGRQGGVWYPVPSFWMELPPTPPGMRDMMSSVVDSGTALLDAKEPRNG
jgi:hypothetical protein